MLISCGWGQAVESLPALEFTSLFVQQDLNMLSSWPVTQHFSSLSFASGGWVFNLDFWRASLLTLRTMLLCVVFSVTAHEPRVCIYWKINKEIKYN